jgi:starch synthase
MALRVAFLAAEAEPWAKTGGLADVVDALARALGQLAEAGLEGPVDVFLPRYRSVPVPRAATTVELAVPDPLAPREQLRLRVLEAEVNGYRLHLVDHPPAFDRDGIYGDSAGDYPDNAWRFGLFCRAALARLARDPRPPDVLHLHDWHTVPALLLRDREAAGELAGLGAPTGAAEAPGGGLAWLPSTAILLTIHNLAYHGWTALSRVAELGIGTPTELAANGLLDPADDGLDLLRAGIERADLVNTVSPGFAAEALEPSQGMGLADALRARGDRFFGILNGLDSELWDPATDDTLAATFSRADRAGKAACRGDLLRSLGMDEADPRPVLAMIGRLDPQKGFDLLAAAAPALLERGLRLVVLGTGTADVVGPLRVVAERRPDRVALVGRFDRTLARRMYAGADGFLMPSRFEPCGTGQMIALRYGTPPIVRATGGLRDTVIDEAAHPGRGTGFQFGPPTPEALVEACDRFVARFAPGEGGWEGLLDRAMAVDFDWRSGSAPAYVAAYRRAVEVRRGP